MKNTILAAVNFTACFIFALFLFSQTALAQSEAESALVAAPLDLSLYDEAFKKLSLASQWKIKRHALRHAPLHPSLWSMLKVDKINLD